MSHDRRSPAWISQFNNDYIYRDRGEDNWYYGGFNGMPLRYHGGHSNNKEMFGHREMDNYSGRTTSSDNFRRRRSSCCLVALLVLGALLVAIGIGVMVYFLMIMNSDPQRYYTTQTNGSLPLLNIPYRSEMLQGDSDSFKNIADPFCREMEKYFKNSGYADQYASCKLEALKPDTAEEPCSCANILKPVQPNNVRAYFNIAFRGDLGEDQAIDEFIGRVIEENAPKILGQDFEVKLVDEFIIDVRSNFIPGPTVLPPRVGVLANLTIWVYNMTYHPDLNVPSSTKYVELARPFCRDLERIFITSPLGSRYHSCSVEKFSFNPNVVVVNAWFTNDNITGLETDVADIILNGARQVLVQGVPRRIVGTLLITDDQDIIVVPIPVNPDKTISPTPTTYRPPVWVDGMPYMESFLRFTGLDFNSSMGDYNSDYFRHLATRFCKDLEGILMQSDWKDDYYSCDVMNFLPSSEDETYPRVRTILKVTERVQDDARLRDLIRIYGQFFVFPVNVDTYKLGDLYVILDDDTHGIYSTPYDGPSTITDISPTMYPSIFTSFSEVLPTSTLGQTMTPPVSTVVTVYNSTTVFIENGLVNFTYSSDLEDRTSSRFISLENNFCNDITDSTVVCSKHFVKQYFKWTPLRKTLKPGSVPTVFNLNFPKEPRKLLKRKLIEPEAPVEQSTSMHISI